MVMVGMHGYNRVQPTDTSWLQGVIGRRGLANRGDCTLDTYGIM